MKVITLCMERNKYTFEPNELGLWHERQMFGKWCWDILADRNFYKEMWVLDNGSGLYWHLEVETGMGHLLLYDFISIFKSY